jgi:hypothetical protein
MYIGLLPAAVINIQYAKENMCLLLLVDGKEKKKKKKRKSLYNSLMMSKSFLQRGPTSSSVCNPGRRVVGRGWEKSGSSSRGTQYNTHGLYSTTHIYNSSG